MDLTLNEQAQVHQVNHAQNDKKEGCHYANVKRGLWSFRFGIGGKHEADGATAEQHDADDGEDQAEASVHAEKSAILGPFEPHKSRFQTPVPQIIVNNVLELAKVAFLLVGFVQPSLQALSVDEL